MNLAVRVTVISDTHMPGRAKALPKIVLDSIERTDAVLHAGDYIYSDLIDCLELLTKFEGVAGNNDGPEIQIKLGRKKIVELNGYRIGMVHGDGVGGTTPQRAKQAFANEKVDIVIFGHSHQVYEEWMDGVLYFNPGSPTDKRRSPNYSYAEITLDKEIKVEIFYF